jgi:hypothetical protein
MNQKKTKKAKLPLAMNIQQSAPAVSSSALISTQIIPDLIFKWKFFHKLKNTGLISQSFTVLGADMFF